VRSAAIVALLFATAHAERPVDPPRWRGQLSIVAGSGGAGDGTGGVSTVFPISAEFAFRVWRNLSVTAGGHGVLATRLDESCGNRPPHAAFGTVGLRADLWNGKSSPWLTPFVAVRGGGGGQCAPFGTGGVTAGLDTWLGRVAVTVAFSYDYLPIGQPLSFRLGAAFILF
jgi:hypothetical protein